MQLDWKQTFIYLLLAFKLPVFSISSYIYLQKILGDLELKQISLEQQ